jgi:hypothetical protein
MQNLDLYAPGRPDRMSGADGLDDSGEPLAQQIARLEKEMRAAAKRLEFEEAAALRDRVRELKEMQIYAENQATTSRRRRPLTSAWRWSGR